MRGTDPFSSKTKLPTKDKQIRRKSKELLRKKTSVNNYYYYYPNGKCENKGRARNLRGKCVNHKAKQVFGPGINLVDVNARNLSSLTFSRNLG